MIVFEKWHGCLNDFIVVNVNAETLLPTMRLLVKHAKRLCDRDGSGVGADGIIISCAGERYSVWIINSDGSFAKNCGNGLRCAAMAFFRNQAASRLEITIGGRVVTCSLFSPSERRMLVAVDMGNVLTDKDLPWYEDIKEHVERTLTELQLPAISFKVCELVNKHLVFFTSRVRYLEQLGPLLQKFADGMNVHIVWPTKGTRGLYKARTYERGVGMTAACGTGACAIAAAVFVDEDLGKWIKIKMPGGLLQVKKTEISEHFTLAGSAQFVFRGELEL